MFAHSLTMTRLCVFAPMLFLALMAQSFADQPDPNTPADLFEMSIEDLMQVPVVISASRQAQKMTELSVPVSVITAEDIRRSGLTSVPQILQFACGIDVIKQHRNSYAVGVRGLHGIISDMRREGNRLIVSVGNGDQNMKVVEAFLEDYIRHHRRKNRPEFKGVKNISPDSSRTAVVVTCADTKEPAREVANDVAKHVERCVADEEGLSTHLFPVKAKGRKLRIRIITGHG